MARIIRLRDARPTFPLLTMPSGAELDTETLNIIHKFGRNTGVGTSLEPVTVSGIYKTPTSATELQAVSNDADDTAAGAGARQLTIQGIVAGWAEGSTTVNLNGTAAVDIDTDFLRIYRVFVSQAGTYALTGTPSQQGIITIKEKTGGAVWLNLDRIGTYGIGQSQISAYAVPTGRIGYIQSIHVTVDSGKTASVYLFRRDNADTIAAPFSGMRLVQQYDGVQGYMEYHPTSLIGPFVGPSDLIFMAKVASTTASVSVNFEILTFATK